MKRIRIAVAALIIVVLVVGASLAGVALREQIRGLFFRTSDTSGSSGLLTAMQDLSQLETVIYVRKNVFPHDYLIPGTEMIDLLYRVSREARAPDEVLSPREYLHFQAANLASELGFATARRNGRFVVVTTVTRIGYPMELLTAHIAGVLAGGGTVTAALDTLPVPQILAVQTEDLQRERYPYGEVLLDAAGWSAVTTFISAQQIPPEQMADLEERGRAQATALLRRLLAE